MLDVDDLEEFWEFMRRPLVGALWQSGASVGVASPLFPATATHINSFNRLLGAVRLRTIRSTEPTRCDAGGSRSAAPTSACVRICAHLCNVLLCACVRHVLSVSLSLPVFLFLCISLSLSLPLSPALSVCLCLCFSVSVWAW